MCSVAEPNNNGESLGKIASGAGGLYPKELRLSSALGIKFGAATALLTAGTAGNVGSMWNVLKQKRTESYSENTLL